MAEGMKNTNGGVSLGDDEHVVDVDNGLFAVDVLEDDFLHGVLEVGACLVDAHGNAVPLEDAELGGEGGEWLGLLAEIGLPVAASHVQSGEDAVLHGEDDLVVGAGNGELAVLEATVGLGEIWWSSEGRFCKWEQVSMCIQRS